MKKIFATILIALGLTAGAVATPALAAPPAAVEAVVIDDNFYVENDSTETLDLFAVYTSDGRKWTSAVFTLAPGQSVLISDSLVGPGYVEVWTVAGSGTAEDPYTADRRIDRERY
jgi:hypothetical protein